MNNRIDERYENDIPFRNAVRVIESLIMNAEGELTPLDIRDACYLARLRYEQRAVRPIIFSERFGWRDET